MVGFRFGQEQHHTHYDEQTTDQHARRDRFAGNEVAKGKRHDRVHIGVAGDAGRRHAAEQPYESAEADQRAGDNQVGNGKQGLRDEMGEGCGKGWSSPEAADSASRIAPPIIISAPAAIPFD